MSSRVYYDSSFEQNEVSKNITGRKKVSRYTRWRSSLKVDKKETKTIIEQRWKQMNTSRNKWKIRQYTNNREMCETMFSSQTRQNVHISTPLPPALFRENTTVVSRTAKMELFFSDSRGDPGLFVRLFLYVADSFFLFQRVFFSECRNSLFRDRRTRFELRDVERRFEGS